MLSQQLPSAEGGCRGDSLSIHLLAGLYLTGWLFVESSQLGRTPHSTQPPSREVRLQAGKTKVDNISAKKLDLILTIIINYSGNN